MKLDEYKVLIVEQCGFPGSHGDSMAETSRAKHLNMWLGNLSDEYNTRCFVTEKGYLRHPREDMPEDWKEKDSSTDQCLPWYLANPGPLRTAMELRIKDAGFKTGNGDLISPAFFALIIDKPKLLNIFIFLQSLLFLFPWRWNDEKKKIESTKNMSGDYLNFFHAGLYSSKWARVLVPKDKLKDRVRHYYKPEPNCEWLINMYDEVINSYW